MIKFKGYLSQEQVDKIGCCEKAPEIELEVKV